MSGGFKAVAGCAFNAELHLTPMAQRLRDARLKSATRVATSPAYEGIVKRRVHHRQLNLRTPLEHAEEELLLRGDIDLQDVEIRLPYVVPPWWSPPRVTIDATKEQALINHVIAETAFRGIPKFYTDGSGHHGEVGAAAVFVDWDTGVRRHRQAHLGTEREGTVPCAVTG